MAIAFRAAGARLKIDIGAGGSPQNVALPTGHVANDLLLLVVLSDDNTGSSVPSGWSQLVKLSAGTSVAVPYTARPRMHVYYRIDNGSLGASVAVSFSTSAWPTGNPYVVACALAYSGCDTTAPIGEFTFTVNTSTTAAQAHPQITTALVNCWLLTFRGVSSDSPAATFTNSVGTDAERVDDSDGFNELAFGLYDSNVALSTGLQTQRTTTASRASTYGNILGSLAIRPAPVSGAGVALPDVANGTGTAFNATAVVVPGPWDACSGGMPVYSTMVDWTGDGDLSMAGTAMTTNAYTLTDLTGWTGVNATVVRSRDPGDIVWTMLVTPNGVATAGGVNYATHTAVGSIVPGNSYIAQCWIYSPTGWTDFNAAVDWYDAANVFLSTGGTSPATVVPAATWTLLRQTLVAPVSASRSGVRMRFNGTPPSTATSYVYGLMLVDPATGQTLAYPRPGDDITPDDLSTGIKIRYGRDQSRQLNPTSVGTMALSVNNSSRRYSPENSASSLYGNLDPARDTQVRVTFQNSTSFLFTGKIDDFNINVERGDRTVDFTFLDGLALLQGVRLSTPLYQTVRTGDVVGLILDAIGWTAARDIDAGATVVPFWWAEGTDAFTAVQDIVRSEGPPSVAYVAPDGTFVFRDRHHRLLRPSSITSQGLFAAPRLMDCTAPAVTGFNFTDPFVYSNGWKDIVNSVTFDVSVRQSDLTVSAVWNSTDTLALANGESVVINASASDPFMAAVTPLVGTDFTLAGAGTLTVLLSRTSGQSVQITLTAVGGAVQVLSMQLRAKSVPVVKTVKVMLEDGSSIASHGQRDYPDQAPWAGANDAYALASLILTHYAQRVPTVQLRVASSDPNHWGQVVSRTISDRITIRHDELGLNSDFYVESVEHEVTRIWTDRPPVHAVVLGCEKVPAVAPANPFTFDKRGAGFDQGVFDPIAMDDPDLIWIWGDPVQGTFDNGLFAT